jgi:PAS domain S-box-containing protein
MLCLCSYHARQSHGAKLLQVMEGHDFILPRRDRPAGAAPVVHGDVEITVSDVLEALPTAIYLTDAEGWLTDYNQAAARLWGYRPEIGEARWCGSSKIFTFDGTPVPHDECPMAIALRTGQPVHGLEAEAERPDGTRVACAVYPTPLTDDNGRVIGGVNMMVDITERRATEERRLAQVREMHHRVNNTLATVLAIMGATKRHTRTVEEFQRSFSDRIQALSRTHAALTERAPGGLSIRNLLDSELAMFADGEEGRVTLAGGDAVLSERLAAPVGMAIHELATNAVKHGALAGPGGTLSVQWRQSGAELEIDWRERGVAIPHQPTRSGFGARLLTEILPRQIGATIDIRYEPDGVHAVLAIPA